MGDPVQVELPGWVADLTDRGVQAVVVLLAVGVAGLVSIALAWAGVAGQADPARQVPYLVSGGIGGAALAGAALAVLTTHLGRRQAARERLAVAALQQELLGLGGAVLPGGRRVPLALPAAGQALVRSGATVHLASCRVAVTRELPGFEASAGGAVRACRICKPDLP